MRTKNVFVGRTGNGDRVYVNMELRRKSGNFTTQDLNKLTEYTEFTASGLVIPKGHRNAYQSGQCLDTLLTVTKPAKGITLDQIREIHTCWKNFHLNGLEAGCTHQDPETAKVGDVCQHCCYRYGSAWLVHPMSEYRIKIIENLMDVLNKMPTTYSGN